MRTLRMVGMISLSLAAASAPAQQTKTTNGLQAGLKGEYFAGPNFERKVLTRTDPAVNFDWNWQSPGPGVPREYFSVRWTGKLYAPVPGKYRFSALADDGVRVWVNGKRVIDEWRKQDDSRFVGEITLAGRRFYDLRVEYYNDWKGSIISVSWALPTENQFFGFGSGPSQVIPAKYLFTSPARPRPLTVGPGAGRSPVALVATKRPTPTPKPIVRQPAVTPAKPDAPSPVAVATQPVQKPKETLVAFKSAASAPVVAPFENLRSGEAVVLRHVRFEQSSYVLLPESWVELDKLVQALRQNPRWHVEVAGHTDNVGDPRLNRALSENRAKVVATYLIRHGIADERVEPKGYGSSRPIADNTIENERIKNRRVEITIH